MEMKRFFLVVDSTGKKRRVESSVEAESASRQGFDVYEVAVVRYKIGPTEIEVKTTTPF